MKKMYLLVMVALGLSCAGFGSLAAFDMDSDYLGSINTQSGWASVDDVKPATATQNGITLVRGDTWKVDRDRGLTDTINLESDPLGDMLRDYVTAPEGYGGPLTFDFSGLTANTAYVIRAWSFNADGEYAGNQVQWQDSGGTVLGVCTMSNTPGDSYVDLSVVSDAVGEISIATIGLDGANLLVNGIEVIPEPATMFLLGLGSLGLIKRRK